MNSLHTLFFFFFNDTATTEIYTLSLHDALPISQSKLLELLLPPTCTQISSIGSGIGPALVSLPCEHVALLGLATGAVTETSLDRKSTRLNSSHGYISYAVFCLKKKKHTRS